MVLNRRAAVCVQRFYANHTRKLRVTMYADLKKMLHAIGTKVRLYKCVYGTTISFCYQDKHGNRTNSDMNQTSRTTRLVSALFMLNVS
jgi:hypothetical protein